MKRPDCIRHWRDVEGADDATYPDSNERFSVGAPLARRLGLGRIGIHHERLACVTPLSTIPMKRCAYWWWVRPIKNITASTIRSIRCMPRRAKTAGSTIRLSFLGRTMENLGENNFLFYKY